MSPQPRPGRGPLAGRPRPPAARAFLRRLACLLPILLALPAAGAGNGEPPWFRVEVIVFGHLDAAWTLDTSGERPEVGTEPLLPAGHGVLRADPDRADRDASADPVPPGTDVREVLQLAWFDQGVRPWALRVIHAMEDVERAMGRRLASRDLASALSPDAPVHVPAPELPDRPSPLVAEAPGADAGDAGGDDGGDDGAGGDDERPVARPAFVALDRTAVELGAVWTRLSGSRGYRPFLFAAWDQPVPEQEVTRLFLEDPEGQLALRLELRRQRFLHVSGDAWLDPEALPDLAPRIRSLLEARARPAPALPFRSEPPARRGARERDRPPRVHWRFERRLRSGETHYLDHPVFGLLVHVSPVSPPEAP